MAASDQGFREFGAKLGTKKGPYNRWEKTGNPDDDARYILQPGVNFMRPWIAVRNGPAFQFPLGMEGFSLSLEPTLGLHKYVGDSEIDGDVIHAGEEHFTLSGNFPGDSAPDLVGALRNVVYYDASREGKLLWLPELVTYIQRVLVVNFHADRDPEARGRDMTYSIEFVRLGIVKVIQDPPPIPPTSNPTAPAKGKPKHSIKVDAVHNTLRKVAAWKLGSAKKWQKLYNANKAYFIKHNIPIAKAPDYRLPIGTVVRW